MEFDWRNTGDYVSVADVIDTAQNIPQLHPHLERVARSILWARPLLFLVPRQRDLPRKTRRLLLGWIVSGSLCVCARSLLITDICSEFC